MLNIYAQTFMTATRTNNPALRDYRGERKKRRQWLPSGHWWLKPERELDPKDL